MISSPLIHLPPEVLLHLFSQAVNPVDQLCLALTCRRLLQVSSLLVIRIPSVAKHRYLNPPSGCELFPMLRRLAPLGPNGRPNRTVALCCDCLWYRPTRKSYWKKDGDKYALVEPHEHAREGWDGRVSSWKSRYSFQCPACWLRERTEILERAGMLFTVR